MADLILVSIMLAFIALCVAYVGWCDRIIGADDPALTTTVIAGAAPTDSARDASAESAVTA